MGGGCVAKCAHAGEAETRARGAVGVKKREGGVCFSVLEGTKYSGSGSD